jgi:hypothetical protein
MRRELLTVVTVPLSHAAESEGTEGRSNQAFLDHPQVKSEPACAVAAFIFGAPRS